MVSNFSSRKNIYSFWITNGIALCCLVTATPSVAQIVPDATLPNNSTVTTKGKVSTITGGTVAGNNLFHSFKEFSVINGSTAYFNNDWAIQNILTRVTGSSVSNINGLIKANGAANLFLINPVGIIFGSKANLDIGGSFLASTADSLLFSNGIEFSATNTQTKPLLTVNTPLGLRLRDNPASVKVQGSNLEVEPNQNLVLVGGDIRLHKAKLTAPGGQLELGGLSIAGEVGLKENGSLNFPNNVARADVSLTNSSSVDVRAGGGGFIRINARNFKVSEGSKLTAGIEKNLGTPEAQAGDVEINASDTVSLDGSKVETQVEKNAKGNAGNIEITTDSLSLNNQASLKANTLGQGNAGQVIIRARDTISLWDEGFITSRVEENAVGSSGGIDITAGILSMVNKAGLTASTEGTGNAGRIIIRASDTISLRDGSFINSRVVKNGVGNSGGIDITTGSLSLSDRASLNASGSIDITTGSLSLSDRASLNADTLGGGNIGQVIIRASNAISLRDGSFINSRVVKNGVGNSGGIDITTGSLSLSNQASLKANTLGQGNAGQIIIRASDTISLWDQSSITSRVEENAVGNSGGIDITTGSLSLSNASVKVNTLGQGNAGQVIIRARDTISLWDEGFITSRVEENAVGSSGGIDITAGILSMVNKAGLTASTEGTGNAGRIIIRASDTISLRDGSFINSRVVKNGVGNSGGIDITTGSLSVTNNGELNVSSFGQGNVGNLDIQADFILLENQGRLTAETASGNGGNIKLQVQDLLLLRHNSQISTNAGTAKAGGNGGNITINAPFIVAVPSENSDITANAYTGSGGKVKITAQGIFGIQFREKPTAQSSDITASSQFGLSGTVEINTLDVDPSQGLAELPVEPANVEVAQGCQSSGKQAAVEFFNTGKGGLAPNPYEPISSSNIWEDVPPPARRAENLTAASASASPALPPDQIVEAQGWSVNDKGKIVLVAEMPTTHSQRGCRRR
ncbi:filamentous hemagglutinin N-terminal domain-containing protein [Coleofasciculus sp. FACHB-SPT9]|uniref:two-partner secretion domain-containing protein n=1 Tax=Cyanophyceae TaxID=3028117 RepID=UPI0016825178|nr:filamentous hemagglutinin N-terminal domain-containing protein [Coleofasciculus sp. FACHB-SPT9]MBD1891580.1 filamentous hemagglutinin N-terminal domain-containing protein [Coleofasciculus sp. FACHB-SPT9]